MQLALSAAGDPPLSQATVRQNRHVYVIDDDADIRRSLHFGLATSDITAWPFAAPEDFLDQLGILEPAPILLDLRMPTLDGMQVLRALSDRGIRWPVIMLSAHGDIPNAVRAMKLGAIDFVEKPFHLEALEEILLRSFEELGEVVAKARILQEAQSRLNRLTPREAEVLRLLVEGYANKVVANKLGLSNRTVESHRANALTKLRIKGLAAVMDLMLAAKSEPQ